MYEHGLWHGFASHQEPGSLISGRGWRCPTVVCSWSPVTLGPALELVALKGGLRRRRESRSLNLSWSRWTWSVRRVHSAYRSQHKPGGEVARTVAPVDGVLTYIAGGRGI